MNPCTLSQRVRPHLLRTQHHQQHRLRIAHDVGIWDVDTTRGLITVSDVPATCGKTKTRRYTDVIGTSCALLCEASP